MIDADPRAALISAITDLEEEAVLALVRRRLDAGSDPLLVVKDCQEGLRRVGLLYERQEYYLAGLIMAGEIFREAVELVQPVIERQVSRKASARILLGTVEGDIHDLGKNIVSVLLGCHSFAVQDLGVDVSPSTFCRQAAQFLPHLVGLSGLVASAYEAMRETVILLRNHGYAGPIVIGGGQLSETVCQYVGADYWTTDAVDGVELCSRLIAEAG
jgi:methanogenic corrinoid protein MtbC1